MKILYVEDNPANVFLVKRVARMGNHEIVNYIDGDKALEMYSDLNPDLILMDIQLAGNKSGLDVVKAMRERGIKTPIIAVTAYAMVGDRERCIEAGCDDYLAKPLPIQRLVEMFKQYSETSTREAQSIASAVTELEHPPASTTSDDSTEDTPAKAGDDAVPDTKVEASASSETTATKENTETGADANTAEKLEANPDEADTIPDRETAISSDISETSKDSTKDVPEAMDNAGKLAAGE